MHQVDEGVDTGAIFIRQSYGFDLSGGVAALDASLMPQQARLLAEVVRRLEQGERATIDTFLEPSTMTRGVSSRLRAVLDRRLRSGQIQLRPPEADYPDSH